MASFEVTTEAWRRTRTSCIFEIKPPLEWKKTSYQTGSFLSL
jgi:hypothetical protein